MFEHMYGCVCVGVCVCVHPGGYGGGYEGVVEGREGGGGCVGWECGREEVRGVSGVGGVSANVCVYGSDMGEK